MKLIINILCAACCLLLCTSCIIRTSNFNAEKIEPSKNITTRTFTLTAFDAIDMGAVGNVKIVQGTANDYRLVLKAPENYVPLYDISVKDQELSIGFTRRNINIEGKHVSMVVYTPALRKLESSGVGSVTMDRLNTKALEIDNSGVGNIELKGIEAETLDVDCSGVGSVYLSGVANGVELECSGVGSINALDLHASTAKAEVSGVGSISCFASERIEGDVSGVGGLKYGGQPKQKDLHRSGVGGISEEK